jgi:hypothetical protein
MPLLKYFSNADLNATKSDEDYVYFTIPFTFLSPLAGFTNNILAFIIFLVLVFIGLAKKILTFQRILRGFYTIFRLPDFLWTDYFS